MPWPAPALARWRERTPADGRVIVNEALPDHTVRYQQVQPEGFEVIDHMLAPLVEPPVPARYYEQPVVVTNAIP